MKESAFQKKVLDFLKTMPNTWAVNIWGGGFMRAGIPDILICCNGRFIAVELKIPGGRVSPLQQRNINLIQEAQGISTVLYPEGFEEFKDLIKSICGGVDIWKN